MAVYCFYLFDRAGRLLCYREWSRARRTHAGEDDAKSMFGLLFALRNFCSKLSPSPLGGSPKYYITETYALHHHETPTGLRFLLLTSPDFGGADISRDLRDLYADAYVPYVVKNPLSVRGEVIRVPAFLGRLDSYVRNLSCF
ncbi:hypothetical protein BU14_1909s0001 [Porphyra umbilicalis]|uniref:Trafficking protein particle complex subunit n=1 Tax=Porphyra umbilicalis TaxID=2786 RepID=A0A1X6NL35_PORUM|nr:hypothetical protein BU14_1909s0001 [Porphyra umbilicalis]|eukprot:OSX69063.1 hypothetical protein BU14_1909s0001 [Porphyra umbilicalis]